MNRRAKGFVALDRDGTIIVERHYLSDPAQVELLPGAAHGLRQLKAMGLIVFAVTNQSAVGRGIIDEARLALIHQRMIDLLAQEGVTLDGIFHCPHLPDDDCRCRKPRTGMLEQAYAQWGLEGSPGVVIGDKACDVDLGRAAGLATVLVRTGYGEKELVAGGVFPDHVAADLVEAALWIEQRLNLSDSSQSV